MNVLVKDSTAQFKLDRTHVQHGFDTKIDFFILHVCKHACACKIDDVKPTVQSSRECTICVDDSLKMHACMSGMHTPNSEYACMQIVSQGQQNKLYKHVHVLSYNPLVIQGVNPAKEFLAVKLK